MVFLFVAAALGLVALAHTAPFPFVLDRAARADAVWRMPHDSGPPTIYFTYDDGPNPTATPALLDVLAREDARATFFLIDAHLTDDTAPLVRRMFDEGHAVALHSNTRALMLLPPARLAERLDAFASRIERLGGSPPCRAFRPHAGWRSSRMFAGLDRLGYRLIGWGWMLWDWQWFQRPRADAIERRVLAHASPGDIVVIHDGHHKNPRADRQYAVEATARLVPALRARGFTFGTICSPARVPGVPR